jgi:alkanesulfonate monooxygenase SsuD/methylene tetrahydromethanopterin reductase-like flavin-dependent oxidoreductase (luciferase family)
VAQARLAEQIGFDSVWVMDHVFIQRGGRRVLAHDPLVTLSAIACATQRIAIGSLVLCHAFRNAVQLAREAAALADASGGRFVLGLGAGWHRPEFDALGLPFDHLVGRLEDAVGPLRSLIRGERTSVDGAWLHVRDASTAVTAPPPPLWLAAEGPRMLALAARCEGWTHAYWGAEDTSRFAAAYAGLREAAAKAGRPIDEIETSAAVACVLDGWQPIPDGFSEPEVAVGPASHLAQVVRDYASAGAGHVILSLSPDPYGELDPAALERSAEILKLV